MVTFTCWQGGRPVALNNLTPPLVFDIPDAESMAVEWGQITERRCVFWNTTSRSWRTEGVEDSATELHARAVRELPCDVVLRGMAQAVVFFFCATDIPAKFLHVEFRVACRFLDCPCVLHFFVPLLCPPCACAIGRTGSLWRRTRRATFRPHHRIPVSSCLPRWFQKTKRVEARRQPTHMSMRDFEATAPSGVLRNPSPCGTRRLYVAHPLLFRAGGTVVVNKGGCH